ncbi:glycosyltransferase family 4 protein [Kocuria sp. UCD-OTCP]|uniref:glycosyltransferase family 4 protein n=1 Tax=Kocuria sp. UCD-OTCP TaxID=1292021 RepID=UPI00035F6747|nr:glycosyltransferase family 4 protein [Kocuria sp. UCD-OTCP]EYT54171.1 glycosyl transferase [Kocuria sp. UCD-OTCP]
MRRETGGGSVRQLGVNGILTAATVREHLADDPVVFWLQVARRLPAVLVHPTARVLLGAPWPAVGATAAHVLGRDHHAERFFERASAGEFRATTTRRLADVALSMGRVAETDRLMERVSVRRKGRAGTVARRDWHLGRMSEAVEGLNCAVSEGAATAGERRQLLRYEEELRLFSGWRPTLTSCTDYVPDLTSVLHVLTNSLPHTQSGYAQRTHSLLTATAAQGWSVAAVTRPGYPVQVGKLGARSVDVIDGIPYHRILPRRLATTATGRLQQEAEVVLDLALRTRPAVLHTTTHFVNALVTSAVAEAIGIPWVYEVRGQLADTWASSRPAEVTASERYRLFTAREAEMLRAADDVVTLGREMSARVRSMTGLLAAAPIPVRIAPNAVGGPYLDEPLPLRVARRAVRLPEDALILGTVTSVVEYEGLDDLLRAAALLVPEAPELLVVVVGDGAARPGLEALAVELGIQGRVHFLGRVPREHAVLYHQAFDVFVLPRKDRAVTRAVTPLKPVEALATGTPVVASCLPALAEVVVDGTTGVLAAAEDPAALAMALDKLLRSPETRRRLGEEGRRRALAERTWDAVASATVETYRHLTGSDTHQEASA